MPKSCTIAQTYFIAHEEIYIAIGCKRIKLPARIVSLYGLAGWGAPLPTCDPIRSSLRLSGGGVSLFRFALMGSAFSVGVTPDPYWLA
jgi:hypothetical protein